ncbi:MULTISPECIES: hypothetical protein [Tritonibacter]|uniref:Uncharacterized protein n=1 Tax=Tritonibacter scottomollicae TaxID=483013 RepID=A0A2T1ABX6_TRISK|nr:hypothetical protein [Tritonibacter scottomollicae]PRZ46007.1 hypothetical protein CLV89_112119 [Tritonibacter scottomollicae]PRZ48045.1 hypothetical protein CLV89_105271 [Tritonibacter scottomollicae]WOI32436.1 hypothetical protein R1T40_15970 [Tritonibacter scottomollicae]WOI34184.1 hypothetical protein R1T40_05485 [Tritonibacter scottomollicae]WOI35007.1 hypothetical protein R1T40_09870 [Tritonibacter scottomollicae]
MTMIENSDRGITLNKSLAWTVACGLVGAGLWVGLQVATLRGETESLAQTINGLRVDLTASEARQTALTGRVRANETSLARQDERLSLILSTLNKIDNRLERMERLPIR